LARLELRDRQQFDRIDAEALQMVDEGDGVFQRTRIRLAEAERPDVKFVMTKSSIRAGNCRSATNSPPRKTLQ
jgi:hypothetical protein